MNGHSIDKLAGYCNCAHQPQTMQTWKRRIKPKKALKSYNRVQLLSRFSTRATTCMSAQLNQCPVASTAVSAAHHRSCCAVPGRRLSSSKMPRLDHGASVHSVVQVYHMPELTAAICCSCRLTNALRPPIRHKLTSHSCFKQCGNSTQS